MKNSAGIISIFLLIVAIIISQIVVIMNDLYTGLFYFVISTTGCIIIVYSYCTKCPKKKECPQIIPGLITNYMPEREVEKYSLQDYLGLISSILIILIYPQMFLFKYPLIFTIFWILVLTATIQIYLCLCPKCKNINCFLCKSKDNENQ